MDTSTSPRRLPRRCCLGTWPTSSTTATRRWPSGGRRRSASIQGQLRELLGEAELRAAARPGLGGWSWRRCSSCTDPRLRIARRAPDSLHDLFLRLGDLSRWLRSQRAPRHRSAAFQPWHRRAGAGAPRRLPLERRGARPRFIAAEDAAPLPGRAGHCRCRPDVPAALLAPAVEAPLAGSLRQRYARTHGPFTPAEAGKPGSGLWLPAGSWRRSKGASQTRKRLLEGAFRPGGTTPRAGATRTCCGQLRRPSSLAKLRAAVEPVEPARRWGGTSPTGTT